MNFKKFVLKIVIIVKNCYYFDEIIKFEDFDFDNISICEKLLEYILIYEI